MEKTFEDQKNLQYLLFLAQKLALNMVSHKKIVQKIHTKVLKQPCFSIKVDYEENTSPKLNFPISVFRNKIYLRNMKPDSEFLIDSLYQLVNIEEFTLELDQISKTAFKNVGKAIQHMSRCQTLWLQFDNSQMEDEDLIQFLKQIGQKNQNLKVLKLFFNNNIFTDNLWEYIIQLLIYFPKIEEFSLNLSYSNQRKSDIKIVEFNHRRLQKSLKSLKKFTLILMQKEFRAYKEDYLQELSSFLLNIPLLEKVQLYLSIMNLDIIYQCVLPLQNKKNIKISLNIYEFQITDLYKINCFLDKLIEFKEVELLLKVPPFVIIQGTYRENIKIITGSYENVKIKYI